MPTFTPKACTTAQVSSSCSCTNAQGSTTHSTNKKSAGSLQRKNSRRHMNIVIIRGAQACRRRLRKKEEEREQTQKKEVEEHTHARTYVRTHAHWKKGGKRCSCLFFWGEREGGEEAIRKRLERSRVGLLFFLRFFLSFLFFCCFFCGVCCRGGSTCFAPSVVVFLFRFCLCVVWVGGCGCFRNLACA